MAYINCSRRLWRAYISDFNLNMASPPATKLGRYRQLSPRAAIHVSPLALGTMAFGTKWETLGMRAMDKESSFKLLDAFFDAGGKFISLSLISTMNEITREPHRYRQCIVSVHHLACLLLSISSIILARMVIRKDALASGQRREAAEISW